MIDFHSHVLPGLDDGAKSIADSIDLLCMLRDQNVSDLVLTPHFHPDKQSMERFLSERDRSFTEFSGALGTSAGDMRPDAADIGKEFRFFPGAEVYGNEFLLVAQNLSPLCIKGTNLLLLEMPFSNEWPAESWQMIKKIVDQHAILPIIAHVDRYPAVRRHPVKVLKQLIRAGCVIQANCDSFVESQTRGPMLKWLEEGLIHLLGTDCHNTADRPPRMTEACGVIVNALGGAALEKLQANGERLLSGKPLHGRDLFF